MFATRVSVMTAPPGASYPPGRPFSVGKIISTDAGKWGYSSGQIGFCANQGKLVSDEAGAQSEFAL